MIKSNVLLPLLLLWNIASAQGTAFESARPDPTDTLTLTQCYTLAETNYPLTRQRALIEKTKEYTITNIAKGVYPQFSVNGSATYQSEVTKITLPPVAG